MNITKGKDYNFDLRRWEILDFSNIREVLINIQNSFINFISPQNYNEILELNSCLKEIIRSNFNKLLNNIIPSFGKEFFEKIIKYNENFKILTLYDNIKYSLLQTLAYYSTIKDFNSVNTLPKDLKLKLYTLNNLDVILENKNRQVLELLNSRIESFIQDSKKYIIRNYSSFLKEDAYINSKFSNEIVKKKSEAINEAVSGMEIDYTNLLNIYLKEKFLSSYTETINTQLNNMAKIIEEQKESLRLKIDNIFTLDPDSILNEINLQTNITLQSINLYNSHFNSFKISDELKEYLNNFGNLKVKPSYESITSLLNEVSKYEIIKNLEENSRQYENSINLDEFNNFSNNTYLYVKDKYIDNMELSLESYGIEEYPSNLEIEINNIQKRNRRRLNGEYSEEDRYKEQKERIADKAIDETFQKLFNSSEEAIRFIKSFEKFEEFDRNLKKYINKLNTAYKTSQKIIEENDYEDEVNQILNEKLEYLKNISTNYYFTINETYNNLKNYFYNSLNNIDDLLNKCANATYTTFGNKYEEISQEANPVDNEQNQIEENINTITHNSTYQNGEFKIEADISALIKKAKFQFAVEFEDSEIKKPKVKAKIINHSRPRTMNFKIFSEYGYCGKIVQNVEIEFNDVNHTIILDFNTKSTNITGQIISEFESYNYFTENYKEIDYMADFMTSKNATICKKIMDTIFCFPNLCVVGYESVIEEREMITQPKKSSNRSFSFLG